MAPADRLRTWSTYRPCPAGPIPRPGSRPGDSKANATTPQTHDAPSSVDGSYYMLMFGGAQLLLSFIPNFHDMVWLSAIAAVMSFSYAFIGLGLGLASTICKYYALLLFRSGQSPPAKNKSMKKASIISILVTTFFYLCCGCFGYAAFGSNTPGNLLTGFSFYKPYWGALVSAIALRGGDMKEVWFKAKTVRFHYSLSLKM
ncbi:hypothetical protein ZWY2020_023476 [Hordeum vulgare]|nr:hypothetical protein ZWY2020_023476 [Hordeum vulgare]